MNKVPPTELALIDAVPARAELRLRKSSRRKRSDVLLPNSADAQRRFWARVDKSGECWLWTGSTNKRGYGRLTRNWATWLAHRYSWFLEHGPIPDGLWVLHHCDVPSCVRPDHLYLGTHDENMRDAVARGRFRNHGRKAGTHCRRGHEYALHATYWQGKRFCWICAADGARRRYRDRSRA